MNRNPADQLKEEEAELERIFWAAGGASGYFWAVRALPPSILTRAIRGKSILPITESTYWQKAVELATTGARGIEEEVLAFGLRSGLHEVAGTRLNRRVAQIAEEAGAPRAVSLVQAVDAKTRQTLSVLIRAASGKYARIPSTATLRKLQAEIRPLLGLTPKQAAQVRRKRRALALSGIPETELQPVLKRLSEGMIKRRAEVIGDRGVIEAVSFGRNLAWLEAQDAGEIPANAMKIWRNQGDDRVRPRHLEQSQYGPVPLREPYPIFGVMHPPAPEHGCRCWENLFRPDRRASTAENPRATSTPKQRAERSEALRRRRREFEARRRELELEAQARRGGGSRGRSRVALSGRRRAKAVKPIEPEAERIARLQRQAAEDLEKAQRAWVYSSRSKTSILFQEAVRREFGLTVEVWNPKKIEINEGLVERYRRAARLMYRQTQADLRQRGISDIVLYRGVKTNATPLRGVLESWTSDYDVAERFSRMGPVGESGKKGDGVVLELRIPAWQVILNHFDPRWSAGRYGERYEWILMGGLDGPV